MLALSLNSKARYLVAVSGGVDSMVLLDLVLKQIPKNQVTVAHFDHAVRIESRDDAAFVLKKTKAYGVPCLFGKRTGQGVSEESLRKERLRFLKDAATITAANFILTAHHLDDQLETFFFRLIRGTAPHGLSGMREKKGRWRKPLLSFSKKEILTYAKKNQIEFQEDATNNSDIYFRNRIRKHLLPVIKSLSEDFGGEEKFLSRFSALTSDLTALTERDRKRAKRLAKKYSVQTAFWNRIELSHWESCHENDKRLLLKEVLRPLGVRLEKRRDLLRVVQAIEKKQKRFDVSHGVVGEISCGYLYFQNQKQKKAALNARMEEVGVVLSISPDLIDAKLRLRKQGDRFGSKKLKAKLIDAKIPAPERCLTPVLVRRENEVVWFLGRRSPSVKVEAIKLPLAARHLLK